MAFDLTDLLPAPWRTAMASYLDPTVLARLSAFVEAEYAARETFPPLPDLFAALRLCSPRSARALILGQDPYHRQGQAHGLSFSVRAGVAIPPSLRNIFKELHDDLDLPVPATGDLTPWARHGVLLLNAVLTVRAGKPDSHAGRGWEHVTDAAIQALNAKPGRVVFLLWGQKAQRKAALVTGEQHVVLPAAHPSPMNARGFLGTRPFSQCNAALRQAGLPEIDWSLTPG